MIQRVFMNSPKQRVDGTDRSSAETPPPNAKSTSMRYRSDIDGLRAIAVLSVVFYHLGLPFITGGYVGVDIFFVISGFLITRIIHREAVSGNFSILGFYERRARRILPALAVVVLASIVAAHFLLAPFDYDDFGLSAVATLLFASNFHFKDAINYFAPAAEFHPLLHTWSLAVEEQFYILFPLLLVAFVRFGRVISGVLVLLVLSFGASVLAITSNLISPETAFYLLPVRAWELLFGSVLALDMVPVPKNRLLREATALLGLVLIGFGIFFLTSQTPFPGVAALLPVVGAALVILAGEGGPSLVGRALSLRPMVFVGLVSYSLYLWHWPILAFLRHMRNSVDLGTADLVAAFMLSMMAATASWWFVERPFRNRRWMSQKRVFALSGAAIGGLSAIGLAIHLSEGVVDRLSPQLQLISAGASDKETNRRSCELRRGVETLCRLGPSGVPADALLWGDSHAGALMSAVEVAQSDYGKAMRLATLSSCLPLFDVRFVRLNGRRKKNWKLCKAFNNEIINWLEKGNHEIKTVVLMARWAIAATGQRLPGEPGPDMALVPLNSPLPTKAQAVKMAPTLLAKGLEKTLRRLKAAGLNVIIVGSVPEMTWNVPRTLVLSAWQGKEPPATPTYAQVTVRHAAADNVIKQLAEKYGAKYILLTPLLCKPNCKTVVDGHSLYVDDNHLTAYGARNVVGPFLAPYFKNPGKL